ncbi:MAG: hypothetical protein ACE5I7_20410, partial [Candidatus Binatia bacterium]
MAGQKNALRSELSLRIFAHLTPIVTSIASSGLAFYRHSIRLAMLPAIIPAAGGVGAPLMSAVNSPLKNRAPTAGGYFPP